MPSLPMSLATAGDPAMRRRLMFLSDGVVATPCAASTASRVFSMPPGLRAPRRSGEPRCGSASSDFRGSPASRRFVLGGDPAGQALVVGQFLRAGSGSKDSKSASPPRPPSSSRWTSSPPARAPPLAWACRPSPRPPAGPSTPRRSSPSASKPDRRSHFRSSGHQPGHEIPMII
jgi:hypothetical protein